MGINTDNVIQEKTSWKQNYRKNRKLDVTTNVSVKMWGKPCACLRINVTECELFIISWPLGEGGCMYVFVHVGVGDSGNQKTETITFDNSGRSERLAERRLLKWWG